MTYYAKVIEDSVCRGSRLTTVEVRFPRFILAEINTHRMFSRSSASSRAIPVEKNIKTVKENTFMPQVFAANKGGMQAGEPLDDRDNSKAADAWLVGASFAISAAERMLDIGVHKQWVNRMLEPYMWHTALITATEWENFFGLRISEHAQPEARITAERIKEAIDASTPKELKEGEWHLPYVLEEERAGKTNEELAKMSTARCARVSYLNHDGNKNFEKDIQLYEKLVSQRHMSPLEHVARVATVSEMLEHAFFKWDAADGMFKARTIGNFAVPWFQHRKDVQGEDIYRNQP